jgi:hypothetical protein
MLNSVYAADGCVEFALDLKAPCVAGIVFAVQKHQHKGYTKMFVSATSGLWIMTRLVPPVQHSTSGHLLRTNKQW